MAKKVLDPKAKAKKQKKLAIGGAVLLVALLAYQGPKTMKLLNPGPPPQSTPAPATTAPVTPGVTPTPVTAAPVGGTPATGLPPSGSDGLVVNADLSPVPLDGQLAALTQFTSKDPFRQQISTTPPPDGSGTPYTADDDHDDHDVPGSSGSFTPGSATSTDRRLPARAAEGRPDGRDDLGQRRRDGRDRQDGLPGRLALLPPRLADRDDGEDRNRGRLAGDRLVDRDAEEGQAVDADEHRRRHALRPRVRLGGRHDDARRRVDRNDQRRRRRRPRPPPRRRPDRRR